MEKPSEYVVMALNGTLQAYCDTIDRSISTSQNTLYEQYKERYPDMSDEQIRSLVRGGERMAKVTETITVTAKISIYKSALI